jgi:uncharacterized protein YutD
VVFLIGKNAYTLAYEHKDGWNAEAFRERYSEILERYDYIVGDWGYNQLRLRGFFREGHPRATRDTVITSLMDYIQEYCNFGCAYFVLAKVDPESVPPGTPDLLAGRDTLSGGLELESGKQTAETAAASAYQNGILMRWPIKERPGGPVWMPGAAAVARAQAEAEKRLQQAQVLNKTGESRGGNQSRSNGAGGKSSTRNASGGGGGKSQAGPSAAGQAEQRGKQKSRSSRSGHAERHQTAETKAADGWRRSHEQDRVPESSESGAAEARAGFVKTGGRWNGKHRRRQHHGKQHRSEGAHRDTEGTARPGAE